MCGFGAARAEVDSTVAAHAQSGFEDNQPNPPSEGKRTRTKKFPRHHPCHGKGASALSLRERGRALNGWSSRF